MSPGGPGEEASDEMEHETYEAVGMLIEQLNEQLNAGAGLLQAAAGDMRPLEIAHAISNLTAEVNTIRALLSPEDERTSGRRTALSAMASWLKFLSAMYDLEPEWLPYTG